MNVSAASTYFLLPAERSADTWLLGLDALSKAWSANGLNHGRGSRLTNIDHQPVIAPFAIPRPPSATFRLSFGFRPSDFSFATDSLMLDSGKSDFQVFAGRR